MSPTYWTASQIIEASRVHGWEIIPASPPLLGGWDTPVSGEGPWKLRKAHLTILIQERRDGGLSWCALRRVFDGGCDQVLLPYQHRDKLQAVLRWLASDIDWRSYGLHPYSDEEMAARHLAVKAR